MWVLGTRTQFLILARQVLGQLNIFPCPILRNSLLCGWGRPSICDSSAPASWVLEFLVWTTIPSLTFSSFYIKKLYSHRRKLWEKTHKKKRTELIIEPLLCFVHMHIHIHLCLFLCQHSFFHKLELWCLHHFPFNFKIYSEYFLLTLTICYHIF